jgi:hypothetical protein
MYVGNAIADFFITNSCNLFLPCINAVNCEYAKIRVIHEGSNPILNQYDYSEIRVRVIKDVGENAVVQCRRDFYELDNKQIVKNNILTFWVILLASQIK